MTQKSFAVKKSLWSIISFCLFLLVFGSLCETSTAFDLNTKLNLKPTKYTEWSKNITYRSSTQYNARGMKPLYEITQKVMWLLIRGEKPLPDGKLHEFRNAETLKMNLKTFYRIF